MFDSYYSYVWIMLTILTIILEYSSNEGINNWTMFSLSGSKLIWMLYRDYHAMFLFDRWDF